MTYEVELKFPLAEVDGVRRGLSELGAAPGESIRQRDLYFAHPQRSFEKTDEALRIRSVGERCWITYKGPVVDSRTKTRHESEIEFEEGSADRLASILEILGFRAVRTVSKSRIPFRFEWEGRPCEAALDEVEGLGSFLEIEMLAEEAERDVARDKILSLASRLGLEGAERKSYLCLLLERDAKRNSTMSEQSNSE